MDPAVNCLRKDKLTEAQARARVAMLRNRKRFQGDLRVPVPAGPGPLAYRAVQVRPPIPGEGAVRWVARPNFPLSLPTDRPLVPVTRQNMPAGPPSVVMYTGVS